MFDRVRRGAGVEQDAIVGVRSLIMRVLQQPARRRSCRPIGISTPRERSPMHVHVLGQQESGPRLLGLTTALELLGHTTDHAVVPGPTVSDAADLGHRLVRRALGQPADVVFASGWLAGLAAQIATRERDIPVVQRLFAPGRSLDQDRRRLEGAIARGATRTVALCNDDVEQLIGLGVRRTSISIVPHGVDTTVFRDAGPTCPRADGLRIIARPCPDPTAAGQLVSMLLALPRSELILLTTPTTRTAVTDAVSAVLGHRPIGRQVRLLDLSDTEGDRQAQPAGTLPALLRSADLVVTTGDDEPELDLALQAMSCGLPIVARATGAMADVVADGVTGVLVPGSSPEALGDAARGLLTDDLRLESFGLAAADRAAVTFAWAAVAPMLARVAVEVTGHDQLLVEAVHGS
jgi:D-inositol-3-phosphate glycosyltransferase